MSIAVSRNVPALGNLFFLCPCVAGLSAFVGRALSALGLSVGECLLGLRFLLWFVDPLFYVLDQNLDFALIFLLPEPCLVPLYPGPGHAGLLFVFCGLVPSFFLSLASFPFIMASYGSLKDDVN